MELKIVSLKASLYAVKKSVDDQIEVAEAEVEAEEASMKREMEMEEGAWKLEVERRTAADQFHLEQLKLAQEKEQVYLNISRACKEWASWIMSLTEFLAWSIVHVLFNILNRECACVCV